MWRWRVEHVLAWALALAAILCPRAVWDRLRLPVAIAAERIGAERLASGEPRSEAETVKAELALVRSELTRAKAQRAELSRLLAQATALAGATSSGGKPVRALPVQVFGAEEALTAAGAKGGRVRIDAGSAQEVTAPAPLVQGAALAGRTTGVSQDAAEAELVTATTFRARCRNVRTGVEGIVRGAGGLELRFRPDGPDPDLKPGDEVVTSAFSTFAPGALAVGVVTALDRDPETGLLEARLAPAAALEHLSEALVVLPRRGAL